MPAESDFKSGLTTSFCSYSMMLGAIQKIGNLLDAWTGLEGSLGYCAIIVAVAIGYSWVSAAMFPAGMLYDSQHPTSAVESKEQQDEPDPPRNFTLQQLTQFNGAKDEKSGTENPVYLSLNGIVFDVSKGREFYGPGGPYEKFAGHECGMALAKMSFDDEHLDDLKGCTSLNFGEKNELDNWISKFRDYRCYPVLGRLVVDLPDPDRIVSMEELNKHNGNGDVPDGYATAPIYIGAGDKVFDVSFGGVTFYGPMGPYSKFAGRNASRALALMSLNDADLENTLIDDCTEKQIKTMNDWIKTFDVRKGYPVVGTLAKG